MKFIIWAKIFCWYPFLLVLCLFWAGFLLYRSFTLVGTHKSMKKGYQWCNLNHVVNWLVFYRLKMPENGYQFRNIIYIVNRKLSDAPFNGQIYKLESSDNLFLSISFIMHSPQSFYIHTATNSLPASIFNLVLNHLHSRRLDFRIIFFKKPLHVFMSFLRYFLCCISIQFIL